LGIWDGKTREFERRSVVRSVPWGTGMRLRKTETQRMDGVRHFDERIIWADGV